MLTRRGNSVLVEGAIGGSNLTNRLEATMVGRVPVRRFPLSLALARKGIEPNTDTSPVSLLRLRSIFCNSANSHIALVCVTQTFSCTVLVVQQSHCHSHPQLLTTAMTRVTNQAIVCLRTNSMPLQHGSAPIANSLWLPDNQFTMAYAVHGCKAGLGRLCMCCSP